MLVVGGSTAYNLVELFRCCPRITRTDTVELKSELMTDKYLPSEVDIMS
jgi:hypothetical protein